MKNKKILLGVTGGIAVYKSADLVRRLREAGAEVRVVMTQAATQLVTSLTFQALSGYPVLLDWQQQSSEFGMDHIALARWADVVLIAPLTADFMAKLAHGLADDVLSTLCLATPAPLMLAPAMNQQMWKHPATQANRSLLLSRGVHFAGPSNGNQACGDVGEGRMMEPLEIVDHVKTLFPTSQKLKEKTVLITAGPTQEPIDPVRYLSNHSSGKMGYALAQAALDAGAKVILVSGPCALTPPSQADCVRVKTAQEMYDAVMKAVKHCDIFIGTAAVADYRCERVESQKIKKNGESTTLTLRRNEDIVKAVAELSDRPFVIGFAAETENLLENAKQKLQDKKLDMMVANDVSRADAGFLSDQNALTVLWKEGKKELPLGLKTELARELVEMIGDCFHLPSNE